MTRLTKRSRRIIRFHILNWQRSWTICGIETYSDRFYNAYNNPFKQLCVRCEKTWNRGWYNKEDFDDYVPNLIETVEGRKGIGRNT